VIDEMLRADLEAPRKHRHTAKRVFDRLVGEHAAVVSYSTVRAYVQVRRPKIMAKAKAKAKAKAERCVADAFIA